MSSPGRIGVQRGRHLVDRAIQFGTSSRYNHVVICEAPLVDAPGYVQIIEAASGGVRRATIRVSAAVWDDLPATDAQRARIVEEARRCLGIPYDWKDIASFVWRFNRVRLTGKPYPDHPDSRLICSELAAWVLRQAGFDPRPGVAAGEISPGDIADWMFRVAVDSPGG